MNETGLEGIQDQLPLGQSAGQPEQYDPSLLVGVPRGLARVVEGIDASLFEARPLELLGSFVAGLIREANDKDRAVGGYGKYPESSRV